LEKVNVRYVLKDYDMKFSISSLVSTLDPHQPSNFAVGLEWELRANTMADMENVM
jgi:hypothetical protein